MPSDNLEVATARWNARAYDPTVQRMNAHMSQVEWEKDYANRERDETKKIFNADVALLGRREKIAISDHYEEELLNAKRRVALLEEAIAMVKRGIEDIDGSSDPGVEKEQEEVPRTPTPVGYKSAACITCVETAFYAFAAYREAFKNQ
jgi:hypothetical protein